MVNRLLILLSVVVTTVSLQAQGSLSLQESLQLARKQNPDLQVSAFNIPLAEGDVIQSQLRPNPIFNTQLLYMTNGSYRNEAGVLNTANGQHWFQVTKPLQIGGLRTNKIAFANKQLTQSKLDFNETSRSLYYVVASKWLDVWSARVNLDILLKGKVYIDSLVKINEFRLKDKVITGTDLARTQLLQQQYQRDIITSQQQFSNELQNLRYLVGASDSVSIKVDDAIFSNINTAGDSLLALGMSQRTDVLSAKNAIDANETNIKLQRSLAYPRPEVGAIFNPQNNIPYVGVYGTIAIPLLDRNQGQRAKAETQRQQAQQNLLATQRQAETEVTTAYRTYLTQRQNVATYESNLAQAATILNSVRYSYLKGSTSIIDLLEAQRSWLDTQQRYYNTMEDYRRSYIQLLYATGLINQLAE